MEEERLDEGFVREWSPCTRLLGLLPPRVQAGLFSTELRLTCIDAVEDYLALGTNVGLIYWYSRKNGTIERLRCEASQSSVTHVKVVNTVDFMVAAGNSNGQVTVFQIPKELPESVPDALRPKTEPKVERYTVGELHRSKITSIEWSKNGMRLFSGDKNGVIIMTEIDFYMHLCKSVEIVNEQYEVVQISYHQNSLLVSTVYRTILCEKKDAKWEVSQVGKKERKSLCALGAVFQWSYARGGAGEVAAYCARPGLRLWRADKTGDVHQTLLFKDAISNPMTIAELLNPSHTKHSQTSKDYQFGPLHIFRDNFIVTHNTDMLYILDPRSLTAVAVVDDLRRILSVSVNKDEIFILEGERSLVRLGYAPEIDALNTGEDPLNAMTKSLSSSIQMAVNTVRDLTHMEPVGPFLTSVLEQPAASFIYTYEPQDVANAEECFELPPVRQLPPDVAVNVLESMIDSFKAEEVKKTNIEDLQRKVRMYNTIVEPKCDRELIFSSKRNKKRDPTSANNTPKSTPVKRGNMLQREQKSDRKEENGVSYTTPCVVTTNYKHCADESDEEMMKQIEEKEKILAKMLNLESLSIPLKQTPEPEASPEPERRLLLTKPTLDPPMPTSHKTDIMTRSYPVTIRTPKREPVKESPSIRALEDVVPKLAKVPPNWNLGSLRVMLDSLDSEGAPAEHLASPDVIESEWEFI